MGEASVGAPGRLEIPAGRARLTAVRQGAGGAPQVVFLHTGISDHRSWSGVLDVLSPDMDVVAYDRRGFGTTSYQVEQHDQVVDLVAVLDALGLDQVVLVGNSRGGQIALDATLTHPARISALVLVAAEAAGALDALNLGEIRLWLDGPHAPEGRVAGVLRELALDMNRIALHAESPGHEPESVEAWSRLAEVRCPVLVVVGDLDLGHIQERCRWLASHIAGAQLAVMEGTAHLPAFEQPATFAALLRQFLDR